MEIDWPLVSAWLAGCASDWLDLFPLLSVAVPRGSCEPQWGMSQWTAGGWRWSDAMSQEAHRTTAGCGRQWRSWPEECWQRYSPLWWSLWSVIHKRRTFAHVKGKERKVEVQVNSLQKQIHLHNPFHSKLCTQHTKMYNIVSAYPKMCENFFCKSDQQQEDRWLATVDCETRWPVKQDGLRNKMDCETRWTVKQDGL